jgi:hypothetical protein
MPVSGCNHHLVVAKTWTTSGIHTIKIAAVGTAKHPRST